MAELAGLHGELFADHEFAALFEDQASLQGMLDFEAALAKAQAETGVIPAAAAEAIARVCEAGLYDVLLAIGRAGDARPAIRRSCWSRR